MMNRRQAIGTGLAVSALSTAGIAFGTAPESSADAPIHLNRLVVDTRFDEAIQISRHAVRSGLQTLDQARDVMETWHDHLLAGGSSTPQPFAGITTPAGLFLLRTLAADFRMRLVFRAEHAAVEGGRIAHSIAGPRKTLVQLAGSSGRIDWTEQFGSILHSCACATQAREPLRLATLASSARRTEPLVTWIIAPAPAHAVVI